MKKIKDVIHETGLRPFIICLLFIAAASGLSWLITCGIVKLLAVLFGLVFKWSIATAIWLAFAIFVLALLQAASDDEE